MPARLSGTHLANEPPNLQLWMLTGSTSIQPMPIQAARSAFSWNFFDHSV